MPTLHEILTDLAAAQHALKQSSSAFDRAIDGMHETLSAIAAANHAQGEAIAAVVAATEKALQLSQTEGGTH